jgi:hypothetical protein
VKRALCLVAVLATQRAYAEPPAAEPEPACVDAFRRAQDLRDQAKLVAARAALRECAQDACSEVIRRKCREWLPLVEADLPSLAVVASGADGRDLLDARLRIDGAELGAPLDGRAIDLDPGAHTVVMESGAQRLEERVVLAQGEKNRVLRLRLAPAPEPPRAPPLMPPPPRRPWASPLALTGFSLGAATLVAGAITGGLALSRGAALRDECATTAGCGQSDIDASYRLAHASTALCTIAGVGVAVGIGGLFLPRPAPAVTAALAW